MYVYLSHSVPIHYAYLSASFIKYLVTKVAAYGTWNVCEEKQRTAARLLQPAAGKTNALAQAFEDIF